MKPRQTHETYIMAIRDVVLGRLGKTERAKIEKARLVYGAGSPGTLGTTYYELWKHPDGEIGDVIEVTIIGEESPKQIAGTMLHEIGHVLCGHAEGHGPNWKAKCNNIGLLSAKQFAVKYEEDMFDADFMAALERIPLPEDGTPGAGKMIPGFKAGGGGCKAGIGTHGGKSRGKGSGSRNKKVMCKKCGYSCHTTRKWLEIGYPICPTDKLPMEDE